MNVSVDLTIYWKQEKWNCHCEKTFLAFETCNIKKDVPYKDFTEGYKQIINKRNQHQQEFNQNNQILTI